MEQIILISKYLSGEATIREKQELEAWRLADVENEKLFQELSESWNLTQHQAASVMPDKERVWQKIMAGINRVPSVKMYSRKVLYRSVSIAATIALFIGFSFQLFFSPGADGKEVCFKTPAGQKAEITLPDGTNVSLNSGSELSYNTDYSNKKRSVKLRGQAFFDVAKDSEHPFDVLAGNIKVVVHGTSFDVNAYEDTPAIMVSLLSGSVSVLSATTNHELARLKPNQKLTVPSEGKCSLSECDVAEEAIWRLGKLKINGDTFSEMVRKMERWYGVCINLKNINVSKRYWITIKTESLKETLEIVNKITPIEYSINGEEVSIICR